MKNIVYTILGSALLLIGCTEDYDLDDRGLSVEELPRYVAFSAPGASSSIAPVDTTEDGGSEELNVEVPGGTVTDITVNYTFSGTAVFGVDFTVDGATSAGGSVVILKPDGTPNLDGLAPNADIVVVLLTDDVVDGDKTLQVTLASATSNDGEIAVGRGGTDSLKTAVVNIEDIDE
ncbi:hypothetical protein [Lentiprolixibacter aurantiacus]|uniref:Calx-beta domain-containing protein n=1 Tax=Lentiprolixibacter aurantiacus TaxID=2993939 RepID=A0AAE3MNI2_9FLAO|nr:hypothetical protein [Lentiprolixibacter aurantiacus]MCX2720693.1 hypothetical protein [Lentiprolixibacter aurantiacus]